MPPQCDRPQRCVLVLLPASTSTGVFTRVRGPLLLHLCSCERPGCLNGHVAGLRVPCCTTCIDPYTPDGRHMRRGGATACAATSTRDPTCHIGRTSSATPYAIPKNGSRAHCGPCTTHPRAVSSHDRSHMPTLRTSRAQARRSYSPYSTGTQGQPPPTNRLVH